MVLPDAEVAVALVQAVEAVRRMAPAAQAVEAAAQRTTRPACPSGARTRRPDRTPPRHSERRWPPPPPAAPCTAPPPPRSARSARRETVPAPDCLADAQPATSPPAAPTAYWRAAGAYGRSRCGCRASAAACRGR
eukprot:745732-Prymnesium_polylepis.1